jgi:predicted metal-dependent TIM-barrel fold hydrolase
LRKFKPTKFADKTKEHPTPLLTLKIVTTFSMLKPFTDKGAYLGLYSFGLRPPEFLLDEAIEAIKEIGADHFVLGTDLGNYKVPYPAPEYRRLLVLLLEVGISEADIEKMARINPERLIF